MNWFKKLFNRKELGYHIQLSKVTDLNGETVVLTTNLPQGATEQDISMEIIKLGSAAQLRMVQINDMKIQHMQKRKENKGN